MFHEIGSGSADFCLHELRARLQRDDSLGIELYERIEGVVLTPSGESAGQALRRAKSGLSSLVSRLASVLIVF